MIDPSVEAEGLYRIATTPGVLGAKVLTEIGEHPNAYPELRQWAFAQLQEGVNPTPPPAPPAEPTRRASRKKPPKPAKPAKPRRPRGRRRVPILAVVGALVLIGGGVGVYAWSQSASGPAAQDAAPAESAAGESGADAGGADAGAEQDAGASAGGEDAPSSAPAVELRANGEGFSCVAEGSAVTCTGSNASGELGLGSDASSGMNTIDFDAPVIDLVAGARFACATDGSGVTCWGDNTWQQTAQAPGSSTAPAAVDELADESIQHLWAGDSHTCASSADTVWCWGSNNVGQAGQGSPGDPMSPTVVPFGAEANINDLYGSRFTTCAVREGHDAPWCWGSNLNGIIDPDNDVDELGPTPQEF